MILYFPKHFDENEWTIIIVLMLNMVVFRVLPKRLPQEIVPLLVLLSISFPKIMDHTMAIAPYDLYNLTDSKKYELFDLILYGAYPMFGYLFIYLYDVWKPRRLHLSFYILSWSFFAAGFEYILVKVRIFNYMGWKLIYSLPVYLVTLCLTFLFYKWTRYYLEKEKT